VIPSNPPSFPPAAARTPRRGGILTPRKLILAGILIGSILFFFLILGVTAVAVLREAAPTGHSGLTPLLIAIKRVIAHHIPHFSHHK